MGPAKTKDKVSLRIEECMDCREFIQNIGDFIDNKIKPEQLEKHMKHYDNCPNCKEEFEIYFLIHNIYDEKIMDNMNDGYNLSYQLKKDINDKRGIVYKKQRRERHLQRIFGLAELVSFVVLVCFLYVLIVKGI